VRLLYANRENDFPYRKELEALKARHPKFRIDYVVSPARIDEKSIPQLVPDMHKPTFYVSGPEPMVESMDGILKKIGVPEDRIKKIRREVVIASEIVEDGREILAGMSFPHREAIQFFRSIS
jgi:ferredoxin-NADP reductase